MGFNIRIPDSEYWKEQIKCQSACPVNTDARGYVRAIALGDYKEAYLIARGPNPLASICGRICAAPCEVNCRRGDIDKPVSIRALKRFASENYYTASENKQTLEILDNIYDDLKNRKNLLSNELTAIGKNLGKNNKKVAIIGSGPAGLACAHDLALLGFSPHVFETEPVAGGMLAVGIPDYRLPRDIIKREVDIIRELGVEFHTGVRVGSDIEFDKLANDYNAIVVAVGAKQSRRLPIPGFDHPMVSGGIEFLRDFYLDEKTELKERVLVIGGGSVAYDVGRSALRYEQFDVSRQAKRVSGVKEVYLCCLESLEEMLADKTEIEEGEEEGIVRINSVGPVEAVIENDKLKAVKFKKCLSVFDENGRFAPKFDDDQITEIECDNVLVAIGQQIDLSFINSERDGLSFNDYGLVSVNPDGSTEKPNIFFAGDCAYGTKLVIDAVADGKKVARTIAEKLANHFFPYKITIDHEVIENYAREASYEEIQRHLIPTLKVAERLDSDRAVVEVGYDENSANTEASRCLDCGVNTIFNGDVCILCGGCVDVCPEFCLKLVSIEQLSDEDSIDYKLAGFDVSDSAIIKDETNCIRCACCADRCPVGAITMERVNFCEVGTNG